MAYQSLYRRYRSQRFDEVLGQDHVTRALRNAVREGRVAQGYLFSGPRGTGKTSTARILAKVLNCAAPVDGEPCTVCEACQAVEQGRSVDWLQELDAASNNKVDDMRDLLSRVSMGTSGNRKVYILDEVHMLTAGAANALLKTLEEPPPHVVFVLATTEPEKVLPTIRSRTQHFDFHLLGSEVLADHVRHVIADAGLGLGEDAVDHVVKVGRGSARDTLSALDQVAAAGGVPEDAAPVEDILSALSSNDASAALLAVETAARTGRDPRVLAGALIESLRHAFLVAMGAPGSGLTDAAAARAGQVADALGAAALTRALEAIGAAVVEMRHAPDPRIPLEVALVRLTRADVGHDVESLRRRIEMLEARGVPSASSPAAAVAPIAAVPEAASPAGQAPVAAAPAAPAAQRPAGGAAAARARLAAHEPQPGSAQTGATTAAAAGERPSLGGVRAARAVADPSPTPDSLAAQPPTPVPAPAPAAQPGPASGDLPTVEALVSAWDSTILESLKGRARALFKSGHFVDHDGTTARFALPNEHHVKNCMDKVDEVRAVLETHFGCRVPLELVVEAGAPTTTGVPGPVASAPPTTGGPAAADGLDEHEDIDLDELVDAPDATTGGLAQLQDAFPGAELVEEQ